MSRIRLGRFIVSNEVMKNSEIMIQIQKDMAVLNVRQDLMLRHYEFLAVGDMFEPVSEAQIPYMYHAEINQILDGDDFYYRVKWRRIDG